MLCLCILADDVTRHQEEREKNPFLHSLLKMVFHEQLGEGVTRFSKYGRLIHTHPVYVNTHKSIWTHSTSKQKS